MGRRTLKREPRVYAPGDRLDVEVFVDDVWQPGELRMWKPVGEDDWIAQVQWRPEGTHSRRISDFKVGHVRLVDEANEADSTSPAADPI